MKICIKCGREFPSSGRHKKCSKCHPHRKPKHPCVDCGLPCQASSKRCASCAPKSGPDSNSWKGGSVKHHAGYIMRYCVGHPKANTAGIYVFEHILVMEEKLGRYLLPGENVHHINGIKDDNRPENLELWIKPQPSGIRVSDAIQWAEEILKRYKK
jgi:hypothetical protein